MNKENCALNLVDEIILTYELIISYTCSRVGQYVANIEQSVLGINRYGDIAKLTVERMTNIVENLGTFLKKVVSLLGIFTAAITTGCFIFYITIWL